MTTQQSMPHLQGLSAGEALLGNRQCSCGRRVTAVKDEAGRTTYECPAIAESESVEDE